MTDISTIEHDETAQQEYDASPELQELLAKATKARTVTRYKRYL